MITWIPAAIFWGAVVGVLAPLAIDDPNRLSWRLIAGTAAFAVAGALARALLKCDRRRAGWVLGWVVAGDLSVAAAYLALVVAYSIWLPQPPAPPVAYLESLEYALAWWLGGSLLALPAATVAGLVSAPIALGIRAVACRSAGRPQPTGGPIGVPGRETLLRPLRPTPAKLLLALLLAAVATAVQAALWYLVDYWPYGWPWTFYETWGPCPRGESCEAFYPLPLLANLLFWYLAGALMLFAARRVAR